MHGQQNIKVGNGNYNISLRNSPEDLSSQV